MWTKEVIEQEQQKVIKAGSSGWLATMILMSLPVFLFDIAWYCAWNVTLLAPYPPTLGGKIFFYGLCLTTFQLGYGVITFGYGLIAIPASLLSFYILVWVV